MLSVSDSDAGMPLEAVICDQEPYEVMLRGSWTGEGISASSGVIVTVISVVLGGTPVSFEMPKLSCREVAPEVLIPAAVKSRARG